MRNFFPWWRCPGGGAWWKGPRVVLSLLECGRVVGKGTGENLGGRYGRGFCEELNFQRFANMEVFNKKIFSRDVRREDEQTVFFSRNGRRAVE